MNDAVKIAGLGGSAAICIVALALGEMNFAMSFGGLFGAILGFPVLGRGLLKLIK